MDKLYATLIGFAVAGVGALILYLRGRRVGAGTATAKAEARAAIKEIRDAVNSGDDEAIQRLLEEKVHEK